MTKYCRTAEQVHRRLHRALKKSQFYGGPFAASWDGRTYRAYFNGKLVAWSRRNLFRVAPPPRSEVES